MTYDEEKKVADVIVALTERISALESENDRLLTLTSDLKLQAQTHAIEARGANATINEIYQIISGGKGEPGTWNGAEPVRAYVEVAKGEILRLETELALSKPVYSRRQLEARAEAAEAEVKRLREALTPFAKFDLSELKQRAFLQILVCPQGDNHADDYRPNFIRARTALASTGGEHHAE
ncbi:hypothetical protein EXN61_11475 [Agrobacterium tumefaciens]|uniref:Uncharacterized protein n=1 Tax=Agrobacterium tumefaciens TaxID=358 RepID=A0A546XYL0_AGRTU|nr:hypothetical protein [Agrobacterium tumefaciens]TRB05847.1 hypothetical protein EXN61_11475 [Agrobacterium tumefaciens]